MIIYPPEQYSLGVLYRPEQVATAQDAVRRIAVPVAAESTGRDGSEGEAPDAAPGAAGAGEPE